MRPRPISLYFLLASSLLPWASALPPACTDGLRPEEVTLAAGTLAIGEPGSPLPANLRCSWLFRGNDTSLVSLSWVSVDLGPDDCDPADARVSLFAGSDASRLLDEQCRLDRWHRRRRLATSALRGDFLSPGAASENVSSTPSVYGPFSALGSVLLELEVTAEDLAFGFEAEFSISDSSATSSPVPSVVPDQLPSSTTAATAEGSPSAEWSPSAEPTWTAEPSSSTAALEVSTTTSSLPNPSTTPGSNDKPAPSPSAPCRQRWPWSSSCPAPLAASASATASDNGLAPPTASPASSENPTEAPTSSEPPQPSSSSAPYLPSPSRHAAASGTASRTPSRSPAPSVSSASSISPSHGASSPSRVPMASPASAADSAAVVVLRGRPGAWDGLSQEQVAASLTADVCSALQVQPYRISAIFTDPLEQPLVCQPDAACLSLQIAPARPVGGPVAADAGDASVSSIVASLRAQLGDAASALLSAPTSRDLDPTAPWSAVWAAPPALQLQPASGQLLWTLPYTDTTRSPGSLSQTITLSNNGGSVLLLWAASVELVSPVNAAAARGLQVGTPYPADLFQLQEPAEGFPLTVLPGSSAALQVVVHQDAVPAGETSGAFGLLQLQHNVPDGPHAVPLLLAITGQPPAAGSGEDDAGASLASQPGFRVGVGAGIAAGAVASCALVGCMWCLCRRRGGGSKGKAAAAAGSSSAAAKAGGSRSVGPSEPNDGQQGGSTAEDARADSPQGAAPPRGRGSSRRTEKAAATRGGRYELSSSSSSSEGESSSRGGGARGRRSDKSRAREKRGQVIADSSSSESDGERKGAAETQRLKPVPSQGASAQPSIPPHVPTHGHSTAPGAAGTALGAAGWWGALGSSAAVSKPSSAASHALHGSDIELGRITAGAGAPVGGAGGPLRSNSMPPGSGEPSLRLRPKPVLKASDFEGEWGRLPCVELWGCTLRAMPAQGEVERLLQSRHVLCIASGSVGGVSKGYFYAQEEASGGRMCMAELSVTASSLRASAVIKAPDPALSLAFTDIFRRALLPLAAADGSGPAPGAAP